MEEPKVRPPPRLEVPEPVQAEFVPSTRPPAPVMLAVPWVRVPFTVRSDESV